MKAKGITVCKGDDGVVRVYVLAGSKRDGGDAAAAVFSAVGAPLALSLVTFEVAGADVTSTASAAPPPAATQPAAQPVPPRHSAVVSQPSERVSSRDREALAAVGMDMGAIMKVADRQRKKAVRVGVGVWVCGCGTAHTIDTACRTPEHHQCSERAGKGSYATHEQLHRRQGTG